MKGGLMIRFLYKLLIVCIVITLPGCHPRLEKSSATAHVNKSKSISVLIVSIDALHPDTYQIQADELDLM